MAGDGHIPKSGEGGCGFAATPNVESHAPGEADVCLPPEDLECATAPAAGDRATSSYAEAEGSLTCSSPAGPSNALFRPQTDPQKDSKTQALASLSRMERISTAVNDQRTGHFGLEGEMGTRYGRANGSLLAFLRHAIEEGHATTLDEAIAFLLSEDKRLRAEFERNPVVHKGSLVEFPPLRLRYGSPEERAVRRAGDEFVASWYKNPNATHPQVSQVPRVPRVPKIRVEGGALVLPALSVYNRRSTFQVIIGKEGGSVRMDDGSSLVYRFPPSDRDRVVLVHDNQILAPHLQRGKDYVDGPLLGLGEAGTGIDLFATGASLEAYEDGHPQALQALAARYGGLSEGKGPAGDPLFGELVAQEIAQGRGGNRGPQDLQARRAQRLQFAQQLDSRNGSYRASAAIFEELFAGQIQTAFTEIPDKELQKVRSEIEGQRDKFEEAVRERLGEGEGKYESSEEINAMVEEAMALKAWAETKKLAFAVMRERYRQGKIADPVTARAVEGYRTMMDPLNETFELSDETWDRLIDGAGMAIEIAAEEAIITAVTMPITMGVGSLVRTGLRGVSLVGRVLVQGGRAARVASGIVGAVGFAAEVQTMNLIHGADFDAKSQGLSAAKLLALRLGGRIGSRIAERLAAESLVARYGIDAAVQTSMEVPANYGVEAATGESSGQSLAERVERSFVSNFVANGVASLNPARKMEERSLQRLRAAQADADSVATRADRRLARETDDDSVVTKDEPVDLAQALREVRINHSTRVNANALLQYFDSPGHMETLEHFARIEGRAGEEARDFKTKLDGFRADMERYEELGKTQSPEAQAERGRLALKLHDDYQALDDSPYIKNVVDPHIERVVQTDHELADLEAALAILETRTNALHDGNQTISSQVRFTPPEQLEAGLGDGFSSVGLGEIASVDITVSNWAMAERTVKWLRGQGGLTVISNHDLPAAQQASSPPMAGKNVRVRLADGQDVTVYIRIPDQPVVSLPAEGEVSANISASGHNGRTQVFLSSESLPGTAVLDCFDPHSATFFAPHLFRNGRVEIAADRVYRMVDEHGVSMAELYMRRDGNVGILEFVQTHPEAQGRGYYQVMLEAAARDFESIGGEIDEVHSREAIWQAFKGGTRDRQALGEVFKQTVLGKPLDRLGFGRHEIFIENENAETPEEMGPISFLSSRPVRP